MLPLLTISTWRCPFSWVIPSRHHRGLPIWSNVDDLGIPHDITAISAGHRRRVYHHHTLAIGPINCTWLVVSSPLKNMSSSVGMIIHNIWKNKCSKPPTRYCIRETTETATKWMTNILRRGWSTNEILKKGFWEVEAATRSSKKVCGRIPPREAWLGIHHFRTRHRSFGILAFWDLQNHGVHS